MKTKLNRSQDALINALTNLKAQVSEASQYDKQAADFLTKNGVKIRITLSDSKTLAWSEDGKHGHHYRVTLSKSGKSKPYPAKMGIGARLTFDFWDSISAMEKGEDPSAYDVLACISSDSYCADSFADFCSEMGESEDSIKALQTFRRCSAFAKRLRAFFSESELAQLQEIR